MKKNIVHSLVIFGCISMMACAKKGFKDNGSVSGPGGVDQILDNPGQNPTDGTNGPGGSVGQGTDTVDQCGVGGGNVQVSKPVKVLFVVDQSGSNLTGNGTIVEGTDPDKIFRLKVMQEFYNQHKNKGNLSWSFISFSGSSAKALVNKGNDGLPVFSSTSNSIATALETFKSTDDSGKTPYQAALAMVHRVISEDLYLSAASAPEYLVAFMTDGVPSDYCVGGANASSCPGGIQEDLLDSDLKQVVSLAPTRIQFGTVYYGPADADASSRLARMAKMGGGQFVDANTNSEIKLNDVITVPVTCP